MAIFYFFIWCICLIDPFYRSRNHCKNMVEGLAKARNIVAPVMVRRRCAHFCVFPVLISFSVICFTFLTLHCLRFLGAQSDEQCCNSCEEVREAYKKKGWALTNPDLIDQVYELFCHIFAWIYTKKKLCFELLFRIKKKSIVWYYVEDCGYLAVLSWMTEMAHPWNICMPCTLLHHVQLCTWYRPFCIVGS